MLHHSDIECPSCGAHWLQLCNCSDEEIREAKVIIYKIVSLEELLKKFPRKNNEN